MSKCPECLVGDLTHDNISKLDQCSDRYRCGYGWYDHEREGEGNE